MKELKGEYTSPEIKIVKFDLSDVLVISNSDAYDNGLNDIEWDFSNLGGRP